ncbi:MAG: hypothetical protein ACI81V_000856 [Lentimonas sp.]|jgi:hypothetical protein
MLRGEWVIGVTSDATGGEWMIGVTSDATGGERLLWLAAALPLGHAKAPEGQAYD